VAKPQRGRKPSKPSATRQRPEHVRALWLAGILVLTFLAYLPSLGNDFTNWDDPLFVLKNPLLTHPDPKAILVTPVASNYHPLTIWSLVLNYQLSGFDPASYHWLNLLLHLANTALVFAFVWQLTGGRLWTTIGTSLFFGIHPMHVESVAWIAERKDVLYAFFYLIGLLGYLQYVRRSSLAWLGATFLAFVCSIASKPSAVVFPLTLLAIDFFRRRPFRPALLLEKIPFFAVSLVDGLLTLHSQKETGAIDPRNWAATLPKFVIAGYGVLMYIVKLFVPVRLSAIYPYPGPDQPLPAIYYVAFAIVAIGLPALVYVFRRNRALLFGIAFFFINIILVLQILTVGEAVIADRYTYLPYLGLFFALTWFLDERPAPGTTGSTARSIVAGCLALLVPLSLGQTWIRCHVWRNSLTLWNDTIHRYPHQVPDAYCNRGWYYYEKEGRLDAAMADFDRAIAIKPDEAKAWLDKGVVLAARTENDSAFVCFDRALKIQPTLFLAWSDRGAIRVKRGDPRGGIEDFSRAIVINPTYREAYANRALAYSMLKEYEQSIADSRRAIDLDPGHRDNYRYLGAIGMAQRNMGRNREAVASLDQAIEFAPPQGPDLAAFYLTRSQAKWDLGERADAASDAREALRLGVTMDAADSTYVGQVLPHALKEEAPNR